MSSLSLDMSALLTRTTSELNASKIALQPNKPGISSCAELSVILPTYNERENVPQIIAKLWSALSSLRWEIIFVDDNSPDGTSELIRTYAARDERIRLIKRVGRRGLSSACIEGMFAANAPYVAIMDADLQHDESVLPNMLSKIQRENLDVVVGSRNATGGSMGDFSIDRIALSWLGKAISRILTNSGVSDPMSGFFIVRRNFFLEVLDQLDGRGFKILLDMLSASTRRLQVGEVGYCFRQRQHGESKMRVKELFEYMAMVATKVCLKWTSLVTAGFQSSGMRPHDSRTAPRAAHHIGSLSQSTVVRSRP